MNLVIFNYNLMVNTATEGITFAPFLIINNQGRIPYNEHIKEDILQRLSVCI